MKKRKKWKWGWDKAKSGPVTVQDLLELDYYLKKNKLIVPLDMREGEHPNHDLGRFLGNQGGNDDD